MLNIKGLNEDKTNQTTEIEVTYFVIYLIKFKYKKLWFWTIKIMKFNYLLQQLWVKLTSQSFYCIYK